MSKSKFLKKILAMGLAVMSFVPAVGAVKGGKCEPPKKISKVEHIGRSEELFSGIAIKKILPKLWNNDGEIRSFIYLMHSIKEIRMAILNDTNRDPKIGALNSLFRIIEGKDEYNDEIIENAYRILDPDDNGWKNLDSLFAYLEDKCGIADKYNTVIDDISWCEEDEDEDNRDLKELVQPVDLKKNSALITTERRTNSFNSSICELKNIKELTNEDNGDKFELCYLKPERMGSDLYYIKHSDGKWYKYMNESIKEVSEYEVLLVGTCVDANFIYNKRV